MEKLQYKIKNGPRVESLNQFELSDGTHSSNLSRF